jgi:phosphatidylglycerophosphate synthase
MRIPINGPNFLSLSRMALTGLAAPLVFAGSPLSFVVIAAALATDFFDGYLARRRGETTMLGRILDPVADKVFATGILIALAASQRVSWELTVAVLARDALLLSVSYLKIRWGEMVPTANLLGKTAFAVLGAYVLAVTAGIALPNWLGVAVATAYVLSAISYAGRAPALLLGRVAKEQR